MAGGSAKKAKAAKPKASSKARTGAKAPTKPRKAVSRSSAKKTPTKKTPAKKTPAKKSAAKKPPVKAVDKVIAAARKSSKAEAKILLELDDLAKYIRAAKRELAAIRPDDVKDEFLPKAADELDAVIEATADATNAIMDACEVVEGVMGDVSSEVSAKLMEATTSVYEACTFQDITGQRIGKVVGAMKHIEERIDALIGAFGAKGTHYKSTKAKKKAALKKPSKSKKKAAKDVISDADLLEGPQLGDNAKSQAEIDDLLASFD